MPAKAMTLQEQLLAAQSKMKPVGEQRQLPPKPEAPLSFAE